MIEPTKADIGRAVLYHPRFSPDAPERGVLTSLGQTHHSKSRNIVFVRYGADTGSKATYCKDLEWEHP